MKKMVVQMFEDELKGLYSEEERETVKEIREMLRRLATNSNCGYGDGTIDYAFYAKWPKYGNDTAVRIAYDSDAKDFKVWFFFADLKKKKRPLKDEIEKCLAEGFESLVERWGEPPSETINPCIPVSKCVGKLKRLEDCLSRL